MKTIYLTLNLILLWAAALMSNAFHLGRIQVLEEQVAELASQQNEIQQLKVAVEMIELDCSVAKSKTTR